MYVSHNEIESIKTKIKTFDHIHFPFHVKGNNQLMLIQHFWYYVLNQSFEHQWRFLQNSFMLLPSHLI